MYCKYILNKHIDIYYITNVYWKKSKATISLLNNAEKNGKTLAEVWHCKINYFIKLNNFLTFKPI